MELSPQTLPPSHQGAVCRQHLYWNPGHVYIFTSSAFSPPPSLLELLGLAVPLASLGGSCWEKTELGLVEATRKERPYPNLLNLSFFSTGDQTKGLVYARQALYH